MKALQSITSITAGIILICVAFPVHAQEWWNDTISISSSHPIEDAIYQSRPQSPIPLRYNTESTITASKGSYTPFWLVNNRQGLSSQKKDFGYIRAGVFRDLRQNEKFSWGAGIDLVGAWNCNASFLIQQLYGEVKYRSLGAMIGSKEMYGAFNNPRLSSGNMLYSGNARPIPQIRVGIPAYTPIPLTHRWLDIKGYIAYGMFTDDAWYRKNQGTAKHYTEHVLYHSKGMFLRLSNPSNRKWSVEGGLEMSAQFGGTIFFDGKVIKMPHNLKNFVKVFFAKGGGSSTPLGEQTNVEGNHVGSWNLCATYRPTDKWKLKAYYNHFFEDHSMMFFDYTWHDGLWGIEIEFPDNPVIGTFVYEYIYTKDQSGPVYWDHTPEIPEQVSGRDNYYNHYLYTGWQHWGMGIGNPLVISPIYNNNNGIYFRCNRIQGHHFGLEGQPISQLGYRVLLSYTRGWGTYEKPSQNILNNFNLLLEATYHPKFCKGLSAVVGVGIDRGNMLGHSTGAMLTIRKCGLIK